MKGFMLKRVLCVLLVACMALSFVSCKSKGNSSHPESSTMNESETSDEPTTLTIMAKVASSFPDQDFGKVSGMIEYQKKTGVKIDWINVDADVFNDRLTGMLAGGDKLPEVIFKAGISNANLTDWGDQGFIIDLAPYLKEYAPNFYKLYTEQDTIPGAITTEDGAVYGMPQIILASEMRTPTKMWINKKALQATGMELPTTTAEFKEFMTAAVASDWNGNGETDEIGLEASVNNMHNHFYGAFGLRTRGAHHNSVDVDPETGELRVFALSENYRKYLEYMRDLYKAGVIYAEIFTEGDKNATVHASSERLVCLLNTVAPSVPENLLDDWIALNWSLEGPDGYAEHTQTRGVVHSTGNFVITRDCPKEKIASALQWVDYFYTEEGSRLALVGVEGKDWEVKEDGSIDWTDAAKALRSESMNDAAFRSLFGLWPSGAVPACFYSNLFGAEYGTLAAGCAQALLKDYAPDKIWPNINYTEDEKELMGDVETDITNAYKSFAAQVITGEVELTDKKWEDFKASLEGIGTDKLIEGYRKALTRVYGEGVAY